MPAPAWTYSDWILSATYPEGSVARLNRLELHIREVSDFISTGNFGVDGKSHDKDGLVQYLEGLKKDHAALGSTAAASGGRAGWTRGKAAL